MYVGSLASLHTPATTQKLRKDRGLPPTDDDEDGQSQGMSSDNAWLFPVMGSLVLLSLYLAFKFLDKAKILLLMNVYFAVAGCLAIPTVLSHLCKLVAGPDACRALQDRGLVWSYELRWTRQLRAPAASSDSAAKKLAHANDKLSALWLSFFAVITVLMGVYLYTKHWILANLIAMCFAVQGIMLIQLDSFTTGFILLGGLFLYDIFWVFGSSRFAGQSVMVSVATNFDGPIKLLVPRNGLEWLNDLRAHGWGNAPKLEFSLLGLGDIVVPGVFAALALSFDQKHASEKRPSLEFTRFYRRFEKPYFTACMVGYVLGLATTMAVMHVFKAGQPALLYLSPSCALSVLFVALARNEMQDLMTWVNPASQDPKDAVQSAVEKKDS